MVFNDTRQFIEGLDKTGDLVRITQEVDWDLEVGAIGRRAYETRAQAVLFENIKDYPGCSILNGSLGTFRRLAIAMGLNADSSMREIYSEYERCVNRPIPPVTVSAGPCKDNRMLDTGVDLYQFPAPYIHQGDGGRYIGTWDIVVSESPDGKGHNWGMYRFMIHNKRYLVGIPRYNSHLGMVLHAKYVPENKRMPVAVVLGADPICHLVTTAPVKVNVSEADVAGGLRGEPVELIKCETSDLLVPAHSEIVIEGEILPDRTATEGPFGEYPGYRTEGLHMGVLIEVKAITFRDSPILTMISLGMPPDDSSIAASMTAGLAMKQRLIRHGLPVTDVYVPPEGVTHIAVVGVTSGGNEVANKVGAVLTSRRADVNKIIVVDQDVDPFDFGQVTHALATKCHPIRGIFASEVESGKGNILTPCYTAEERRAYKGAIAIFDCTWPPEWPKEEIPMKSCFEVMYPDSLKEKVLKNWEAFGF